MQVGTSKQKLAEGITNVAVTATARQRSTMLADLITLYRSQHASVKILTTPNGCRWERRFESGRSKVHYRDRGHGLLLGLHKSLGFCDLDRRRRHRYERGHPELLLTAALFFFLKSKITSVRIIKL